MTPLELQFQQKCVVLSFLLLVYTCDIYDADRLFHRLLQLLLLLLLLGPMLLVLLLLLMSRVKCTET